MMSKQAIRFFSGVIPKILISRSGSPMSSSQSTQGRAARDTRFLYIKFYSGDPKFSAVVANAFAKSYTDHNLELKVAPFREAGQWFASKMKDMKGKSDKATEQLREYQKEKGIITQEGRVMTTLSSDSTRSIAISPPPRPSSMRHVLHSAVLNRARAISRAFRGDRQLASSEPQGRAGQVRDPACRDLGKDRNEASAVHPPPVRDQGRQ